METLFRYDATQQVVTFENHIRIVCLPGHSDGALPPPIYNVLREGGGAAQHSARYKSLLQTKWMALFGASLAVLSSTASCANVGIFFVLGGAGTPLFANPYFNIMVLGMLLVCGVLKNAIARHW